MKIKIDNGDNQGLQDYTPYVASEPGRKIRRPLNRPMEFEVTLESSTAAFVVPVKGARIVAEREDTGAKIFTGYISSQPEWEYLGWGERGPMCRFVVKATSDEALLDRKSVPARSPFVGRSAGEALRTLIESILPGAFVTTGINDLDLVPYFVTTPEKKWSEQAREIALLARAVYRAHDGEVLLKPVGDTSYTLDENDPKFTPAALKLVPSPNLVNDLTIMGRVEPQAYVKDYFIGDGYSLRFDLSIPPFRRFSTTVVDEEYSGTSPAPTRWTLIDPAHAITVASGKLQASGGTGTDGKTTVCFAEKIEMSGAQILQHGDVAFTAASDGVIGGLYSSGTSLAACAAGFRVSKAGGQSNLQALVGGLPTGPILATQSGHRYDFTTRLYALEIFRNAQVFHSSQHPAGNPRGGDSIAANVRVVLEIHDIDPNNPGSLVAPSTVLYDGVISAAPNYCTYALLNCTDVHCTVAFTRITQAIDVEVRSALPGQTYRTRLAGLSAEGAECHISQEPALYFFPDSVPASGEQIVASYRTGGRAVARLTNPASIAQSKKGDDDGVRGAAWSVSQPASRLAGDCENAVLALLDDTTRTGWSGAYEAWSDCLPGDAADIFPGDGLHLSLPSQGVNCDTIVREVAIDLVDLNSDLSRYTISFADDTSEALAFLIELSHALTVPDTAIISGIPPALPAALSSATVTEITSTTIAVDTECTAVANGGFEVRRSDYGWGMDNDRNLAGRFSTRAFTLPRLARTQDYYLRQYDGSMPPRYSRYSTLLHVAYPL